MAVEGTLEVFKLPEILQMISQQQKTGILTVQGQQDIIAVSFLKGQVVTVDSLNQTQEEGLSQILIKEGLLTGAQFARASSEHQSAGMRLLDFLVERNFVQRDVLLRSLRLHATRLLGELLRWDKGEFKFYGGDEVPYEEGFVPITVEEVLVAGAPRRASGPVPVPGPRPVPTPLLSVPSLESPASTAAATAGVSREGAARPGLRVVRREGTMPADRHSVTSVPAGADEPEATGPFRKMKVEEAEARRPVLMKALAAVLATLALLLLVLAPAAVVIPFPWQDAERLALADEQKASLYQKIDRAAKTWFLLEGRFPERLAQLVDAGFLSPRDLADPQGRPFQYSVTEESYTLQPLVDGKPVPGEGTTEAITGNFLLDPGFLSLPAQSSAQPLV
ncbi:MAG TPA: DUF4388 domain-containing protein, partial [Thermoanaerobaculia bacterium]|nr:DUF4388 domain-containing protein [Thermoanaerobaculia bacterium]